MVTTTRTGPELIEAISDWIGAGRSLSVGLGPDVSAANERVSGFLHDLRLKISPRSVVGQDDIDVLHAAARLLSIEVTAEPASALGGADLAWNFLKGSTWDDDELGERDELLCCFAFICWRASRLLDLPHRKYEWEMAYRLSFRRTLHWDVGVSAFLAGHPPQLTTFCGTDPERIFQSLLVLQENCDSIPHLVASRAELLYRFLVGVRDGLPSDLAHFFVGVAARITGASRRLSGSPDEAFNWLDVAEGAFQEGICARPELARIRYQRLAVLYGLGRLDLVNDATPILEKGFFAFGMREDQVKCRILWASSLKISGRCENALDALEPLRQMRHEISPALFGRVLLELGDLHQIEGDHARGLAELDEAAALLREGDQLTGLADAASVLGASCRARGMLNEATKHYEEGREAYSQLGIKYLEAYMRILLAETYLAMGKLVEAERQVLAALPTLQEQHMVVEVTAGIGILREAANRKSLDPMAQREFVRRRGPKQT